MSLPTKSFKFLISFLKNVTCSVKLTSIFPAFIETVSDKVSGLFEKKEPTMAEKAADKIDAAKEYTQEKAHDASEGIKNAGDKTVDTGKNIGDDIKGAFK